MADNQPLLRVEGVSKSFGDLHVLNGISFEAYSGETLSILGKSGSGKSVLLKIIVGLLDPDEGRVLFHDKEIGAVDEHELNELRKEIGFLFQSGALFDSMTIGENLNLILSKHTDLGRAEREERVIEALSVVGLEDKIDEMPAQLSGGQRKRGGLARSIVLRPKLMLFDEPTTGLDPLTASQIADLILWLQKNLQIASIVVTHDLPTAFAVSDRMILLKDGVKAYDGSANIHEINEEHLLEFIEAARLEHKSHKSELIVK